MALESSMNKAITGVIIVALIAALAPQIFTDLDSLNTATGVPGWVPTVLVVIAGAGLVFLVYRNLIGKN